MGKILPPKLQLNLEKTQARVGGRVEGGNKKRNRNSETAFEVSEEKQNCHGKISTNFFLFLFQCSVFLEAKSNGLTPTNLCYGKADH
jgi:hypothetical protein